MCLFAIIKSYLFADRLRCIIDTIAQACRAEFNRPTPSAILYDNVGKLRNGNHLFEIETSLEITDRERFRFFYFFTWIKITVNTYKQFPLSIQHLVTPASAIILTAVLKGILQSIKTAQSLLFHISRRALTYSTEFSPINAIRLIFLTVKL